SWQTRKKDCIGLSRRHAKTSTARSVEQEFPVAFSAEDGRVDRVANGKSEFAQRGFHLFDSALLRFFVAHNAAFAHVFASDFELRLDENEYCLRFAGRDYSRKNKGRGDERHVHDDEVDRLRHICGAEIASVRFLMKFDARVVPEFHVDLAIASVDGDHTRGSVLEETVGEAPGGGTDVHAGGAANIDVPMLEGALEFESAAADITKIVAEQTDGRIGINGGARLFNLLFVDEDAAGDDQRLGALAGRSESAVGNELVETLFQNVPNREKVTRVTVRPSTFVIPR